jgi:hypothetical protein
MKNDFLAFARVEEKSGAASRQQEKMIGGMALI